MPRSSAALISSAVGCGAPGTETRARADAPGSPERCAGSTYSGVCPAAGAPEVGAGGADVGAGGPDAGGAETAADAEARPATAAAAPKEGTPGGGASYEVAAGGVL
ncbi:hypothetical protein [Phytohabitans aurantiacus]|uniref:hypothetical protein n=1 Tax=Phytohabitans aurantiacus TaxID=3016789 RepID=UPI0024907D44|nr:hypothetical protein [Phytohabitans aurantiacus]